ncbi:MAG: S23 ribosomal protein [uncultured bacterium]|nr:MAG: S23 ribosomal protein [uncultured bacterium]KKP67989.1 MAG: S23 ribosomal protein [Candidatus Moranbacteria bacterium GW2011_GWE1_35_17]KKP72140.1 MAG: S23 ribosomal protein [Candidatus Moranbacteria bacterium GW2011_GWE2_35_164]KKP83978.1 MAG: S23 ribosomal protein [Candidatus Moranbacteria bacterium GW2011_GWF2_35_54]KKP84163.1 MAG: S23 ribosomal protein [Candidatus Moranbacteria bacterium GW2011_GWF1_35_5]
MENKKEKIKSFTDLNAWREGHKLVLEIYNVTKLFPEDERFGLISQMRRCVVSITSNIAEGFSRKGIKEKIQFYHISLGSITELQNQLVICRDLKILDNDKFKKIAQQTTLVQKITNGLIKSTKYMNSES